MNIQVHVTEELRKKDTYIFAVYFQIQFFFLQIIFLLFFFLFSWDIEWLSYY